VAGRAVAFADPHAAGSGRLGVDVGGWEGHEDDVAGETAVAGAVVGLAG
jgi:hypothetical protein